MTFIYATYVQTGAQGGQERALDPLELQFQGMVAVGKMLGTEPIPSASSAESSL